MCGLLAVNISATATYSRVQPGNSGSTISPPTNGGSSSSGGGSSGSGGGTVVPVDTTPPTVHITPDISNTYANPTSSSTVSYTIKCSDNVGIANVNTNYIDWMTKEYYGDGWVTGIADDFQGVQSLGNNTYRVTFKTHPDSDYKLAVRVRAGFCSDAAGNSCATSTDDNDSGDDVSGMSVIYIDRKKPQILSPQISLELIDPTYESNGVMRINGKTSKLTMNFDLQDYHINNRIADKDISIVIGEQKSKLYDNYIPNAGKQISVQAQGEKKDYIEKYDVKISEFKNQDGEYLDGELNVSIPAGRATDLAGNSNDEVKFSLGESATKIIVDSTEPEITKAQIKSSTGNIYVANGGTITLELEFSEELSGKPTVKLAGRTATVTGSGKNYTATYEIAGNERIMEEGEIGVEISDYQDLVGLKGETRTETTDGSKVIYDKVAPTVNFIEPNGDTTWRRSQSTVISVKDDKTAKQDITGKYAWVEASSSQLNLEDAFVNESKITKDTGTGKFKIYAVVEDLAGNQTIIQTNEFWIDNSVTNIGTMTITKGSKEGEMYQTHERTIDEGTVYEGGYTSENLYLHKNDGTDEESGHQKTIYQVTKLENGKEIAVGSSSTEDTIIENDGDYKIVVTTYDNLNNVGSRVYIIHKGVSQVTFAPNGNDNYQKSVSTQVTVADDMGLIDKIYYEWVKEGEEPKNINKSIKNGQTISLTDVIGEYRLYIRIVDKDGNENICRSEIFKVAGQIAEMGSLMLKYNNEQGDDYIEDTYTKENIYIKIANQGSDPYGGKVTSTYQITRQETDGTSTAIGTQTNETTVLTSEGEYTATLTSTNELGVSGKKQYKIKIDKTAPSVKFYGIDTYQETGHIQVKITDDGICNSDVNQEKLRYYWTRSKDTPNKGDFEGEHNEYRGTINSVSSIIRGPSDVSGIWYLWVYAEDNAGNASIQGNVKIEGGNISYIDTEAPIAGTLKMTEETEEKKDYVEGTYTKESVRIKLLSGYDADSGIKSNTYSIKKNQATYKTNLTADTVLTEDGIYTVTVTTIDNQNNQSTREYTIKIDKNSPTVVASVTNKEDYSRQKQLQIKIDDGNGSGVNSSKTLLKWIGYNPNCYDDIEAVKQIISEMEGTLEDENKIKALEKLGIFIQNQEMNNTNLITTPERATGIYCLVIQTQDNIGNETIWMSEPLKLDNTNPTRPEISVYEKESLNPYYGSITKKDIQIEAKNSVSLSGVDKYLYAISEDNGISWSDWKEANYDGEKAVIEIAEEGDKLVKIKAVAELLDGTLESQETEQIAVKIDKTGPSVTFSNYENGENGSNQVMKSILVRITATEQNSNAVNPNTLKYEWVKFADIEEYNQYANREKTWEDLRNKMTENAKPFSNGEEVPSPENANGIYSLFVYSEDMTGNASIHYSNSYRLTNGSNGSQDEDSTLGDINGDGVIDLIDLSRLQQHIIGRRILSEEEYRKADLNQDGEVDISDLSKMMFIIARF